MGTLFPMVCEPEPDNRFDRYAVLVKAPVNVPENIRFHETRPHPRRQIVEEILGKTVGHVPKHICNVISANFLIHKKLKHAVCFYTGEMEHEGLNGPKLKCFYCLEFTADADILTNAGFIRPHVNSDEMYL